ncbi:MAG TPA: chromate efflux transporter [Myxococcota bacterium]|nr:chromate efflux transporter [Myxococcota bacterium]
MWAWIGLNSFGGPAGQIALMHRVVVEERRWVGEKRFLHALNYCMLLPGPEAQQLAVYLGWLLHGYAGGLAAGILFVIPGFLAMLGLSILYAVYGSVGPVEAAFFGLKAAVLSVVVEAVLRIGKRALKNRAMEAVAALSFLGIFLFALPFPLIVAGAALLGLLGGRWMPALFVSVPATGGNTGALDAMLEAEAPAHTRPSLPRALRVGALGLTLWLAPVLALYSWSHGQSVYSHIATFFSKTAVVTFGGAYAVLAYIAQAAVEQYGWMKPGEMLDGLGMAETTPGPLIMVVEFVAFLAAYRNPGALSPLWAGCLGATLATWVTFAPCFLWIFVGAPWVEWLRGNRAWSAALSTITAAVVGVVLNLSVWFSLHVLFARVESWSGPAGLTVPVPVWSSLDPAALVISVAAMLATLRFHVGILKVLAASVGAGILWWWLHT